MVGASFDGKLNANALQAGDLQMVSASFRDVNLVAAKITGQLAMPGASFDGTLDADSLQVGGDLFMRHANCAREVDMVFARVGGNLDLRGASLHGLDLSGASILVTCGSAGQTSQASQASPPFGQKGVGNLA